MDYPGLGRCCVLLARRVVAGVRARPEGTLKLPWVPSQDVNELLGVYRLRGVAKNVHHVGHVFFVEPDTARLGHSIPRRHQSSTERVAAHGAAITYEW